MRSSGSTLLLLAAVGVLLLVGDGSAQRCDKPAMQNLNASRYLGVWYEIARFGQASFEDGAQCVTAEYSLAGDNNVTVHNTMFNKELGAFEDIVGWAQLDDPSSGEAKLTVHFPEVPVAAPYWVLDTDYKNYSIVWACREPKDETSNITETSWILSRTAQLSAEQQQQVNERLEALGLPRGRYTDTPQDPQQCVPRVSTCDKPAVAQFNASQYLGVWYEIARFGQASFEDGAQCVTAEYSLAGTNNVTVHNTMFNKELGAFEDIVGWAQFDDPNAREAKLTVHFPEVPVEAPYWVLDTDYETYSIVWSCREPTDETSNITETSWILSRSNQLSAELESHVNQKLESLGLARSRYTDTPQDAEQCVETTVRKCRKPAVGNFDPSKYGGLWYEIARFGETPFEKDGKCVTAEYALSGANNVTVNNTMFNATAAAFQHLVGWAQLDDPASAEGKLTVHFPGIPGAPYWVLDTDYTNYSIVWSCKEPNDDVSNITESSWLLSRTRALPEEVSGLVDASLSRLGLARSRYSATPQDPEGCKVKASGSGGGAGNLAPAVALTLASVAATALLFSG